MSLQKFLFYKIQNQFSRSYDYRKILLVKFYQSDEVRLVSPLSFMNSTASLLLSVTGRSS